VAVEGIEPHESGDSVEAEHGGGRLAAIDP